MKLITPEGFAFRLTPAGLPSRTLAWLLDEVLLLGSLDLLGDFLHLLDPVLPGLASATGVIVSLAASLLYFAALEYFWHGQTIGKRALGLRVLDAHGLPLTGAQILFRNLLRAVDFLPALYLVGGLAALASRRAQRIGDLVAGTVVIRRPPTPAAAAGAAPAGRFNSLRENRQLALRLRESASAEEAALIAEALERRDRLAPVARATLYRQLVDHFAARTPFPPELRETLSDEQILRSLLALLYEPTLAL